MVKLLLKLAPMSKLIRIVNLAVVLLLLLTGIVTIINMNVSHGGPNDPWAQESWVFISSPPQQLFLES